MTITDRLNLLDSDVLANTKSNLVIFRGSLDAKLLILGEAPGWHENNQKIPFVGASGYLLSEQLFKAGLDESECIFINSVFRMPTDINGKIRCPTDNEIEHYRPYVSQIIREVKPDIILALGNSACYSLIQEKGITSLRGGWYGNILPTFHPSYILRNPDKLYLFQNDLKQVRHSFHSKGIL
jgi:DNA polymerase